MKVCVYVYLCVCIYMTIFINLTHTPHTHTHTEESPHCGNSIPLRDLSPHDHKYYFGVDVGTFCRQVLPPVLVAPLAFPPLPSLLLPSAGGGEEGWGGVGSDI
jgi:hypothetical protein